MNLSKRRGFAVWKVLLILMMLLAALSNVLHADTVPYRIYIANQNDPGLTKELKRIIHQNKAWIPLRPIAEMLGLQVQWRQADRTILLTGVAGDERLKLADKMKELLLHKGQAYVPLGLAVEKLGVQVKWDSKVRSLSITPSASNDQVEAEEEEPWSYLEEDGGKLLIQEVPENKYPFQLNRKWRVIQTKYFQVYFYAKQQDVLALSSEMDQLYSFYELKLGELTAKSRIQVYIQTEDDYRRYAEHPWSTGYWNTQGYIVMQLKNSFSANKWLVTFKHELAHAFTYRTDGLISTPWFLEAVSTYYELTGPYASLFRESELYRAYSEKRIPSLHEIPDDAQLWSYQNAPLYYAQAQSFYAYLIRTYGESNVNRIWQRQGYWEKLLEEVTGRSLQQLETEWMADLVKIYGSESPVYHSQLNQDGSVYMGEFLYGRYHGSGWLMDSRGTKYVGGFVNGKKEGYGKFIDAAGNIIEAGIFISGEYTP